jgi:hypothetical protein
VVASDSWTFKFNSPIANAWNLEDKQLNSLNVFSAEQFQLGEGFNTDSLVYLGWSLRTTLNLPVVVYFLT